ncbi:MAG: exodeoxyribonuclease V subunit gamma [Moheibacter sp.]
MSIQLKISNSLESLSSEWCQLIDSNKSVFRPVYVVTQTEGMDNWLKEQAAQKLGISANIRFLKPNDIIHEAYRILGGKYEKSLSVHDLNWLLFELLNEHEFKKKYSYISSYYNFQGLEAEMKRMALAEKTADLFDQYQIYRYKMIRKWNENKNALDERFGFDESWQRELWFRAKEKAGSEFPDKTNIGGFILNAVKDSEKVEILKQKLQAIHFFGLSLITEYHLMIIDALSEHIEVRFLIQNPSPNDYWYDDKSEKVLDFLRRKRIIPQDEVSQANPLLVNWGRTVQDTFKMLFENDKTLNGLEDVDLIEPQEDTLLHQIQHSIFNNQKENVHFSQERIYDGSITVNSCYSTVREVEVLYSYLVELIDRKDEKLSARDIVVMVSDIDLYASYIKAVFDNAPFKFPYTIADESYQNEDNIFSALIEILVLNRSQFTSEKVLSLLDYSAIRNEFGIKDTGFARNLVRAANIRLGIAGDKENESNFVSWKYGLKRIMYGLCMSGETKFDDGEDQFFPIDTVEGYDIMSATAFVAFAERVIDHLGRRKGKRKVSEWMNFIWETVESFIGGREENENDDYLQLTRQLKKYNVSEQTTDEEVSFEVFSHNFLPILSTAKRSAAFAGRGITFCSLIPMRSIPFKVVALLGINNDKFPRIDKRVSFDLTQKSRKRGDRNLKENDKHLFLENVLSAKDYFYVSYVGQSIRDNTKIPASILVDELIDFIANHSEKPDEVREKFITEHPLHGFSKKYNSGNQNLISYLIENKKPELNFETDAQTAKAELDEKEIQIKSLLRFFKNPVKFYYNQILRIYYENEDLSLPEAEVFELDQLQKWKYKNDLLKMPEDVIREQIEIGKMKGKLPLKNMGGVELEKILEETEAVRQQFLKLTESIESDFEDIDLEIDGSRIAGRIERIFGDRLIECSFSGRETKYRFEAYLKYLLLAASGKNTGVCFISKSGDVSEISNSLSKEDAQSKLEELIKIYKIGTVEIFPYTMDLIDSLISKNKAINDMGNIVKLSENYMTKVEAAMDAYMQPFDDPYFLKEYENGAFDDKQKTFEKFSEAAEIVLLPLDQIFIKS